MAHCDCQICKFNRRFKRLKNKTLAIEKFFNDVFTYYENIVTDSEMEIVRLREKYKEKP